MSKVYSVQVSCARLEFVNTRWCLTSDAGGKGEHSKMHVYWGASHTPKLFLLACSLLLLLRLSYTDIHFVAGTAQRARTLPSPPPLLRLLTCSVVFLLHFFSPSLSLTEAFQKLIVKKLAWENAMHVYKLSIFLFLQFLARTVCWRCPRPIVLVVYCCSVDILPSLGRAWHPPVSTLCNVCLKKEILWSSSFQSGELLGVAKKSSIYCLPLKPLVLSEPCTSEPRPVLMSWLLALAL